MVANLNYFYRTSNSSHTIIQAVEGIEQGDAAGPALFACGLKKPLDDLRAKLETALSEARAGHEGNAGSGDCVAVFAYLDDTIVSVPADLADRALNIAVETIAAAGHTVNPGKSACWSHSSERSSLPSVCQEIWSENGL